MLDVLVAALGGFPVRGAEGAGDLGDVKGVEEFLVGFGFGGGWVWHDDLFCGDVQVGGRMRSLC